MHRLAEMILDDPPFRAPSEDARQLGTPSYRVVAALDFSELGDSAFVQALRLCGAQDPTELHVVTVAEEQGAALRLPGPEPRVLPLDEAEEAVLRRVRRLLEEYQRSGGEVGLDKIAIYVACGSPAERIISLASTVEADVIVVGTHGRRGLERMLLGSVAEEVLRRAPCAVFAVRARAAGLRPRGTPPRQPGEHPIRPFLHPHRYHYVALSGDATAREP